MLRHTYYVCMVCMWKQLEGVGFLLCHVSLPVIKLGSKYLYLLSYLGAPGWLLRHICHCTSIILYSPGYHLFLLLLPSSDRVSLYSLGCPSSCFYVVSIYTYILCERENSHNCLRQLCDSIIGHLSLLPTLSYSGVIIIITLVGTLSSEQVLDKGQVSNVPMLHSK